ncbi:YdcF family protein [Propionibacterium australiense]|uniref:Rossmann-like alpha/beta/alpha sandwich fold n=1 Tax=Propionibacterium australiense TaxID=119981 RepID=A0A383S5M2_9ACTN|nr:ElyC/SanA/YdcF family protein [Propionibacterium australiense]RLP10657.1 hypothetical protein D9T14_05270 [Propionibacterium australiense]RLP12952.1 hypothetical protein D7U36_00515 [Propionibacterium australiense]SYZ32862.1 Rossmann-like alpha/beta/alpha sandwich fold [Propionibacterium australiense]VEH91095.1 DUF218 domain [Propionibacterium australiense]
MNRERIGRGAPRGPGRFRRIGWAMAAALALVLVVLDVRYVAYPRQDVADGRADVLFVLGPHDSGRVDYALQLMDGGAADELVVSTPSFGSVFQPEPSTSFCTDEHPYPVTCFVPEPSTTRGEAAQLARWRTERGWDRVIVLTTRPHVSRTRYIMGQCAGGPVAVWSYDGAMTPLGWAYQFAYQGLAFIKAIAMGECR